MSATPYSAPVWKKLRACGEAVEASLARSGVLLTMGGEPTFVPVAPTGAGPSPGLAEAMSVQATQVHKS